MAGRQLPGLGLKGDWALGEDNWKDENDLNLLALSVLTQGRVLSLVSATPGSPDEGDVHIFDETHPTHANAVAVYDEGGWKYFAATAGMIMWNMADSKRYEFKAGEWSVVASGGGGGGALPAGGSTGQALVKLSDDDGDAGWDDVAGGGGGGGDIVLLEERQIVAGSGTLDFVGLITDEYRDFEIEISDLVLSGTADVFMRYSQDNGATFDANAIYTNAATLWNQSSYRANGQEGDGQTRFNIFGTSVMGSTEAAASATMTLHSPLNAGGFKGIKSYATAMAGDNNTYVRILGGRYRSNGAVNAFRIYPSAGTFTSGFVRVYGKRRVSAGGGGGSGSGGSGGMTLIDSFTAVGGETGHTFTDIPDTFSDLIVVLAGRTTGANYANLSMRFNGDAGSNYDVQRTYAYGGSTTSDGASGVDSLRPLLASIGSGATIQNAATSLQAEILGYAETACHKAIHWKGIQPGAGGILLYSMGGVGAWRSLAAINSLAVDLDAYAFAEGVSIRLYGR